MGLVCWKLCLVGSLLWWVPPVTLWGSTASLQGLRCSQLSPMPASYPASAGSARARLSAHAAFAPMLLPRACRCPGHSFMMSSAAHSPTHRESVLLKRGRDTAYISIPRAQVAAGKVSSPSAYSGLCSSIIWECQEGIPLHLGSPGALSPSVVTL